MTELSFLVELLLNHKLPKTTRALIASRIKDVEEYLNAPRKVDSGTAVTYSSRIIVDPKTAQAPSMQAIMARNLDLVSSGVTSMSPPHPEPLPVAVIAQTPAAMAALNARQESIAQAMTGKPDKGRTSPRKF